MANITVTYEIRDGYAGASRPQTFKVDTSDFVGMSTSEIANSLQEQANEDMMERISADIAKFDDVVMQIVEAAAAEEAAENEEE